VSRVIGISRVEDNENCLLLTMSERPTDEDIVAIHEGPALTIALIEDQKMRMEIALRLIRVFAMGDVMLAGSAMVRDWLKDYIDGKHHGPPGGPLLWPGAIGTAEGLLRGWGFSRSPEGYVVLKRKPDAEEAVQ
jgi:hypothetical protein